MRRWKMKAGKQLGMKSAAQYKQNYGVSFKKQWLQKTKASVLSEIRTEAMKEDENITHECAS